MELVAKPDFKNFTKQRSSLFILEHFCNVQCCSEYFRHQRDANDNKRYL